MRRRDVLKTAVALPLLALPGISFGETTSNNEVKEGELSVEFLVKGSQLPSAKYSSYLVRCPDTIRYNDEAFHYALTSMVQSGLKPVEATVFSKNRFGDTILHADGTTSRKTAIFVHALRCWAKYLVSFGKRHTEFTYVKCPYNGMRTEDVVNGSLMANGSFGNYDLITAKGSFQRGSLRYPKVTKIHFNQELVHKHEACLFPQCPIIDYQLRLLNHCLKFNQSIDNLFFEIKDSPMSVFFVKDPETEHWCLKSASSCAKSGERIGEMMNDFIKWPFKEQYYGSGTIYEFHMTTSELLNKVWSLS